MGGDEFPNAAKSILIFRNPHLNFLALAPIRGFPRTGVPEGFWGPPDKTDRLGSILGCVHVGKLLSLESCSNG